MVYFSSEMKILYPKITPPFLGFSWSDVVDKKIVRNNIPISVWTEMQIIQKKYQAASPYIAVKKEIPFFYLEIPDDKTLEKLFLKIHFLQKTIYFVFITLDQPFDLDR